MLRNNNNADTISNGEIIESKRIKDILKLIRWNTGVLMDLDNTVMKSSLELGGDTWFVKLNEYACKLFPQEEAIPLVLAIYHAVQHYIWNVAVEPEIVKIIKALQHINTPVVALTSRDYRLNEDTRRQLSRIGIDFCRYDEDEPTVTLEIEGGQTAYYEKGIIYCCGNDKGICLKKFLSNCESVPPHFVMVDDKKKYLDQAKKAVEHFNGLRYGLLDDEGTHFDMNKANIQLACINHLLPANVQRYIAKLNILPSSTCFNFFNTSNEPAKRKNRDENDEKMIKKYQKPF